MKNNVLKVIILGVVLSGILLAFSFTVGAAENEPKVGYIDLDRIQQEIEEFKELQELARNKEAELNSFAQYLQAQFNNTRSRLLKEREEKKEGKTTEEQKAIDKEYDKLLQQAGQENQKKLEAEKARLSAEIQSELDKLMNKVRSIVEEVAKEEGITVVFHKNMVFYGGTDLTDKVIAALKKDNGE